MSSEWKIVIKQIVLFGFLLAVLQLVVFISLSSLVKGETLGKFMTYQFYSQFIQDLLPAVILFLVLYRIGKRMQKVNFLKMLGSAVVFLLLAYHISFLLRVIYFYSTHPNYAEPGIMGKAPEEWPKEIAEHGLNLFLPHYDLIQHFIQRLFATVLHFRSPFQIIIMLLNPTIISLWISTMIWLLITKKNHPFYDESTLDNE